MKIHYFADTDTLYIDLSDRPSLRTEEISDLVSVDFDIEDCIVGITIESAKNQVDLSSINILANLVTRPLQTAQFRLNNYFADTLTTKSQC